MSSLSRLDAYRPGFFWIRSQAVRSRSVYRCCGVVFLLAAVGRSLRPPAQGMYFRWCVLSLLACLRMHLSILWSGWIAWWCARPRRPPSPCSPRSTVGVAGSGGTGGRPPSRGDTAWPWPVRRGGQTPAGQWENGRHVTNGKKRDRVAAGSSHHTAGEAAVEDPTSRRDPARGVVNRRRQRWETPPPPGWAGGSATAWRALTTHAPPHRPPPTTPSPSRRRTRTRAPHTHAHRGVASRGQTDGMGGGAAGDAVGVGGSPPRTTLGQGPASRRRAAWLVAGSAQTPDPTGGQ